MTENNNMDPIPGSEVLKLDNQLCFALYVTSKEIIKRYKPILKLYDLTYTGYITMMALWESDKINVKDLGKTLLGLRYLNPAIEKTGKQRAH